jgi:hypothetical protein
MPFGSGRQNRGGNPIEYIAAAGSSGNRYFDIHKFNQAQQEFKSVQGRIYSYGSIAQVNFSRISVSPNGQYLFCSGNISPYYFFFKRVGDNWLALNFNIPFPATSNTQIYGGTWSPDSTLFVTYYTASPYLTTFVRNGDTFTQYLNFPTVSYVTYSGYDLQFNPAGNSLAASIVNQPFVIFNYVTATNTWTNVAGLPDRFTQGTNQVDSVGWNYNGTQLSAGSNGAINGVHTIIYNRSGDTFTTASNVSGVVRTFAPRFNPVNTTTIAIAGFSAPNLIIAAQNTSGVYTSTGITISGQPGNTVNRGEWSSDGQSLVLGLQASPYLSVYLQTGTNYYQSLSVSQLGLTTPITDVQWINYPKSPPNHSRFGIFFNAIPYYQEFAINGTSITNVASVIDYNPFSAQPGGGPSSGAGADLVKFNNTGSYLVTSNGNNSPYFYVYSRSSDTFTRLANPASVPASAARGFAWTNNLAGYPFTATSYLAMTNTTSPFLRIYYVTGSTITLSSLTIPVPSGGQTTATGVGWAPNDANIVVGLNSSPFYVNYNTTSSSFTIVNTATILPTSTVNSVQYSPDSSLIAMGMASSPGLMIYTVTNNTFNLTGTNITTFPNTTVYQVAWTPDSQYLGLIQSTSPYLRVYSRSVNTFTSCTITTLPLAAPVGLTWNSDGSQLYLLTASNGVWSYGKTGTTLNFISSGTQDWSLSSAAAIHYKAIF